MKKVWKKFEKSLKKVWKKFEKVWKNFEKKKSTTVNSHLLCHKAPHSTGIIVLQGSFTLLWYHRHCIQYTVLGMKKLLKSLIKVWKQFGKKFEKSMKKVWKKFEKSLKKVWKKFEKVWKNFEKKKSTTVNSHLLCHKAPHSTGIIVLQGSFTLLWYHRHCIQYTVLIKQ